MPIGVSTGAEFVYVPGGEFKLGSDKEGDLAKPVHTVVLSSFISPYRSDRDAVRALHAPDTFVEVFVDTPIEVCEARDVKGLYKKARAGEIPEFSGISAPYEAPETPELRIDTTAGAIEECAALVVAEIERRIR